MSNLSFIPYIGNGVTKEYGISFTGADMGYLRQSDVKVLVEGVQVSSTINPASPHLVILDEAPPVGSQIIVRREMPIDTPYADFSRGNNFGYRQVNNSFLQQLYLTHELLDGFYPEGFYFKQAINFGGYPLKNIGDGVEETDAVSVGQAAAIADKVSGANFVQEEIPKLGLRQGLRWYKPSIPATYTYYIDTSGSGQWVEESSVGDDTSAANIMMESEPRTVEQKLIELEARLTAGGL